MKKVSISANNHAEDVHAIKNHKKRPTDFPKTIYLERDFRNLLFSLCYQKAGSLREIGIEMGYTPTRGLNGMARNMWLGRNGIPWYRIEALSKLSGLHMECIYSSIVSKDENIPIDDWVPAYEKFQTKVLNSPPHLTLKKGC